MRRRLFLFGMMALLLCQAGDLRAQTGNGVGINGDYTEPDTPNSPGTDWNQLEDNKLYVSWASRDVQYKKHVVPADLVSGDMEVLAWRGERVGVEAVLYTKTGTGKLALKADAGSSGLDCQPRFMNYVKTNSWRGAGYNNYTNPFLVPDVIDIETTKAVEAKTTRPVWVTVEVPRDIAAGTYDVPIRVLKAEDNSEAGTLNLKVTVCDKTLPLPADQRFFLNFWQQPYAISRYYQVENWSEEHLEALRPYLKMLARAGQKAISAILFYEPWGEQSNDKFQAMIKSTKKSDGTWEYDYTIFDKWVALNKECGITEEIHCFSMMPWDNTFKYYEDGKEISLNAAPGSTAYTNLWTPFLKALAQHLKDKGWPVEKTYMAIDERNVTQVQQVYNLVHNLNLGFKVSLCGSSSGLSGTNLASQLEDYCLEMKFGAADPGTIWTADQLSQRRAKGFRSTYYTCCTSLYPNIILNNNQADGAYLPIYAVANDCDGYLHWAWCNWTDSPLMDGMFKFWGGGDSYLVYPGNRSGVRFERMIEGVQLAEKVRLLREEYTVAGKTEALQNLNAVVSKFASGKVSETVSAATSTASLINSLQKICNPVYGYCEPQITKPSGSSDEALAGKIEARWLASVTSEGAAKELSFSSTSASEKGYVRCPDEMQVTPGQTFTLKIKAHENADGLQFCRLGAFVDWDGDTEFEAMGSVIGDFTPSSETGNPQLLDMTLTFTVPADARLGLSRIRLSYGDAWDEDNVPTACGDLLYGFAFDIPVQVVTASAETAFFLSEDNDDLSKLTAQTTSQRHNAYLRRTLSAGQWNSLVLPITMTGQCVRETFGTGVKLAKMTGGKDNGGYIINFKLVDLDTDGLDAGSLYIIKPGTDMRPLSDGVYPFIPVGANSEERETVTDGSPMVFKIQDVAFDMTGVDQSGVKTQSGDGDNDLSGLQFKGIYIKASEEGLIPAHSFVLSSASGQWNRIVTPINSIRGFRAWIDTTSASEAKISFCMDGVEDDVTAIDGIGLGRQSQSPVYDLHGRKVREAGWLDGLAKGVYVVHGRKVVVR